jgi:hypothetical protein
MSYTGRVHYLGYYNRSGDTEHQRVFKVLSDRLGAGQPIYVRWRSDDRREGSVGLLSKFEVEDISHWYSPRWGPTTSTKGLYFQINDCEVTWTGRRNVVKPMAHELEFLEDWEEGSVWAWNTAPAQPKPPIPTITGHLGEEIVIDDFVSFVSRRYGTVKLHFGNVARINHNGTVWVNTLKLRDDDSPQEVKVHDPDTIVKIGKDLIDRLMMARLAVR